MTFLYCSKCNVKIKHNLLQHWELVHWKKETVIYPVEDLVKRRKQAEGGE